VSSASRHRLQAYTDARPEGNTLLDGGGEAGDG